MHDGTGDRDWFADGLQAAVCESIRNVATLLPGMFAPQQRFAAGEIARFCGPLPRLGSIPISVSLPSSPMRYAAML